MRRQVVADFGRGELAQSAVRFEAVDYSLEVGKGLEVGDYKQGGEAGVTGVKTPHKWSYFTLLIPSYTGPFCRVVYPNWAELI